jgi:predicted amidohydrolase
MIIASAQTWPTYENIEANLLDHYRIINTAAANGVQLLVFPEMSITGYVHEAAEKLLFVENDSRLEKLRQLAKEHNMIVIAGAPVKLNSELHIGSFIIFPNGSISIYTKQFLHPGEEHYFVSNFVLNPVVKLEDEQIAFAICADIDHPQHAENARKKGASLYIASIFFSPQGLPGAYSTLSAYAKKFSLNVLMSNFCGESWKSPAAGGSAFWTKRGEMVGKLDNTTPGLIIVQKKNGHWVLKQ